jgi:hypothetical protein
VQPIRNSGGRPIRGHFSILPAGNQRVARSGRRRWSRGVPDAPESPLVDQMRAAYRSVQPDPSPYRGDSAVSSVHRPGPRDRVTPASAASDLPVRDLNNGSLRHVVTPVATSGLRRLPGLARSRHPPHRLPLLLPGTHRAGALGPAERAAHHRLRERRCMAGPAHGQGEHRPATAQLLGSS